MNRILECWVIFFACILFCSSSCFIPFYNLALKKIKRKYEHWCKIEALFIFCTDQISIQFSLSHEWFLQMNMTYFLAIIDMCARNNKQFVDLYGYLWFKWTNTFISKLRKFNNTVRYSCSFQNWIFFSFLDALTLLVKLQFRQNKDGTKKGKS